MTAISLFLLLTLGAGAGFFFVGRNHDADAFSGQIASDIGYAIPIAAVAKILPERRVLTMNF